MSQDPLHLLCVETRFPGRLAGVADWLVRKRGYRCTFFCNQAEAREAWPESVGRGMEVIQFQVGGVARETSVPWTKNLERSLCHAYGAWEVIDGRRPRPVDVVLARSAGMGSSLFVPVSLPRVPIVNLFDYYVRPRAHDLTELDLPALPPEYVHWRRSANAMDLLDLENGVVPWTPTRWQRDLYPSEYRDDFVVLHDGVDARRLARGPGPRRTIAGRTIPAGTRVVTFVARSLDRLRGFDRFLGLANAIARERPDVLFVAAGDPMAGRMLDVREYGQDAAQAAMAADPPPDPDRLWLLGPVAPATVSEMLAASDLHVVASRPYPVARSTIEAMAAGAVVLAWDVEPIRELLEHGRNALVVPVDDPDARLRAALAALDDPAAHRPLAEAAVATVRERYDRDVTLPEMAVLFDRLAGAARPQGGG